MANIITLLTDFGTRDGYVGAVKGVILSLNPSAVIVDITHDIAPQNVYAAAFILGSVYKYFPPDTIHLAIVDPGVGTSRLPIIVTTPAATVVAPDNGIASFILEDVPEAKLPEQDYVTFPPSPMKMAVPQTAAAVEINDSQYWLPVISHTFHGRDIFAPVAAHLSLGIGVERIGRPVDSINVFPRAQTRQANGQIQGTIVHIDRFGNLITNIRPEDVPHQHATTEIAGQIIQGISGSYAETEGLLAIFGGFGFLEVALKDGNASQFLLAKVGDRVMVTMLPPP